MNPLLFIPTPRGNIPEVIESDNLLDIDIIRVKFKNEYDSYNEARRYFLEHEEYTHLIIKGDDDLVFPKHLNQLIDDIIIEDYPIVSGIKNVDERKLSDCLNITFDLPEKHDGRTWNWVKKDEFPPTNSHFHRVGFAGFPLMAIRRDIITSMGEFLTTGIWRKHKFTNETPEQKEYIRKSFGCCIDLTFCHEMSEKGIQIIVDDRIIFKHLRYAGEIMTGIKSPYTTITRKR